MKQDASFITGIAQVTCPQQKLVFQESLGTFYEKILSMKKVLERYELVQNDFDKILKRIKPKIKWIIIAEAPQSHEQYIYNLNNKSDSVFLRIKDVAIASDNLDITEKDRMIAELIKYEILIADKAPSPT